MQEELENAVETSGFDSEDFIGDFVGTDTDSSQLSTVEIDNESDAEEIESEEIESEVQFTESETQTELFEDSTDIATEVDTGENDSDTFVDNDLVFGSFDYTETLQYITEQNEVTNELLLRINNQNDFIIALAVTFIISMVCYKILHGFTKV